MYIHHLLNCLLSFLILLELFTSHLYVATGIAEMCVILILVYRYCCICDSYSLGKGKGTPLLKAGIRCIGLEPEDDSEQSDWQGF